jgi:hypothetical protein
MLMSKCMGAPTKKEGSGLLPIAKWKKTCHRCPFSRSREAYGGLVSSPFVRWTYTDYSIRRIPLNHRLLVDGSGRYVGRRAACPSHVPQLRSTTGTPPERRHTPRHSTRRRPPPGSTPSPAPLTGTVRSRPRARGDLLPRDLGAWPTPTRPVSLIHRGDPAGCGVPLGEPLSTSSLGSGSEGLLSDSAPSAIHQRLLMLPGAPWALARPARSLTGASTSPGTTASRASHPSTWVRSRPTSAWPISSRGASSDRPRRARRARSDPGERDLGVVGFPVRSLHARVLGIDVALWARPRDYYRTLGVDARQPAPGITRPPIRMAGLFLRREMAATMETDSASRNSSTAVTYIPANTLPILGGLEGHKDEMRSGRMLASTSGLALDLHPGSSDALEAPGADAGRRGVDGDHDRRRRWVRGGALDPPRPTTGR